ncbi:MAG TPA: hypothetical protein VIQ99_00845, partial [Gammaproteobacteria bacterium]
FILTDGDPQSDRSNTLAGADFRYRNSRLPGGRVLEGQTWYQETDTEGVVGDNKAYGFGVSSPNNTGWRGGTEFRQIEQNFDPAVGFVNETGIRTLDFEIGYRHRFVNRVLRSVLGGVEGSRVERLDTGLLDRQDFGLRLNIEGSSQERGFMMISTNEENIPTDFTIYRPPNNVPGTPSYDPARDVVIPAGNYTWEQVFGGMRTGNQRKLSGFIGAGSGEYYDGERTQLSGDIDWRPSEHLRLGLSYSANDVSLPDGDFVVRISSFRAQYAFSSRLSWVNLIQYDNVSENLGFNSRLHWIPQAGREGFIVLNHGMSDIDQNDSFHSLNADVTVKFSYTFRF